MDLYDDSFKLQDMIDSDIRTDLDEFLSCELSESPEVPTLTALTPVVPMDLLETTLDTELSEGAGTGWLHSSQLYGFGTDIDSTGGLLVNPQTALPVTLLQPQLNTPVFTTVSPATEVSLTHSQAGGATTNARSLSLPTTVQVIATTATLVSHLEQRQPQVNLTVAVPTPSPSPQHFPPTSVGSQTVTLVQHLHPQQHVQQQEAKSQDTASPKSKQKTKVSVTSKQLSKGPPDTTYPKPAYSYSCLIAMALKNSKTGSLPVNEIYDFMTKNFPYFKTAPNGWKNSVRHNLSLNKCFEKVEKPTGNGTQRKGYLWAMNPAKIEKMEEELQKWSSKDPIAIRRSMANPENLSLLEKGHLKIEKCDSIANKESEIIQRTDKILSDQESGTISVDTIGVDSTDLESSALSPLDGTVNMDSSLPDLDLQKGIWEDLCEDRLQFLSDSSSNSLSPKPTALLTNQTLSSEDSEPKVSSPSSCTSQSFVHANYVYTQTQCTPSNVSTTTHQVVSHPNLPESTGIKRESICDA